MTGIQSPYEVPEAPDLTIISGEHPFQEDLDRLVRFLEERQVISELEPGMIAAVTE